MQNEETIIKLGSTVRLKSVKNEPEMIIVSLKSGTATCVWFEVTETSVKSYELTDVSLEALKLAYANSPQYVTYNEGAQVTVRSRGNGPKMTINKIYTDSESGIEMADCIWFLEKDFNPHRQTFPRIALMEHTNTKFIPYDKHS